MAVSIKHDSPQVVHRDRMVDVPTNGAQPLIKDSTKAVDKRHKLHVQFRCVLYGSWTILTGAFDSTQCVLPLIFPENEKSIEVHHSNNQRLWHIHGECRSFSKTQIAKLQHIERQSQLTPRIDSYKNLIFHMYSQTECLSSPVFAVKEQGVAWHAFLASFDLTNRDVCAKQKWRCHCNVWFGRAL